MESPSRRLLIFGAMNFTNKKLETRLAKLFNAVNGLIKKHNVEFLAFEIPLGKCIHNQKTNDVLNQVKGVLSLAGALANIKILHISSARAKKTACPNVRYPSKQNVLEAVNKLYQENIKDFDISDSIAVGLAAIPASILSIEID